MSDFTYELAKHIVEEEPSDKQNKILVSAESLMVYAEEFDSAKAGNITLRELLFIITVCRDVLNRPIQSDSDRFKRFEMPLRTYDPKKQNSRVSKRKTPLGARSISVSLPVEMIPKLRRLGLSKFIQEMVEREYAVRFGDKAPEDIDESEYTTSDRWG